MPLKLWPGLGVIFALTLLSLVEGDVSQLPKDYIPPEASKSSVEIQADEAEHKTEMSASSDGAYYGVPPGVPLPPGYNVPTGSNVPPPQRQPPNFPLPIYPPFFGFGGPQIGPNGPGGAFLPPGQQFAGPGAFPNPGQFPGSGQGFGGFQQGPGFGPGPGPAFQGQFPGFQQGNGFGLPQQPYQQLVGHPFMGGPAPPGPPFPQFDELPASDEPSVPSEADNRLTSDTVYGSNGGYIYQRA